MKPEADNSEDQVSLALPNGTMLGRFRIIKWLGQGSFGITYLAEDTDSQQSVVIKENLPVSIAFRQSHTHKVLPHASHMGKKYPWSIKRFIKEAQLLANLDHPNIVKVTEAFEANGTAYYVMEYFKGEDLRKKAPKPHEMTETFLRPILCSLLKTLDYLHKKNILHRDIKPSNILLTDDGDLQLIDFGTARNLVGSFTATTFESEGYTPYEQTQNLGNVGFWTDLYALGATCYRLIIGKHPPKSTKRIHKKDPYVPLVGNRKIRQRYSEEFLAGIDKALALEPENRWQSATEWLQALPEQELSVPTPPRGGVSLGKAIPWGISGLLLTSLFGVTCYFQHSLSESLTQLEQAQQQKLAVEQQMRTAQTELDNLRAQINLIQNPPESVSPVDSPLTEAEQAQAQLAEQGITPDLYNSSMRLACSQGHAELVQLLTTAGADVNSIDPVNNKFNRTPLIWAAEKGHTACVDILLKSADIDVNLANEEMRTPLYWAARGGHHECLKLLLNHPKINPNLADNDGLTPLHVAALHNKPQCVRALLDQRGILINALTKHNKKTALTLAREKKHLLCADMIRKAGGR